MRPKKKSEKNFREFFSLQVPSDRQFFQRGANGDAWHSSERYCGSRGRPTAPGGEPGREASCKKLGAREAGYVDDH